MGRQRRLSRTLMLGAVAGLLGARSMGTFTRLWRNFLKSNQDGDRKPGSSYSAQERDATERIAEIVAARVFERRLSMRDRHAGSIVVHYGVGAASGAVYALLPNRFPFVSRFCAILFGAAMWLVADELLMPALGVTRALKNYSAAMQANALGEHIVFALTTDQFLRLTHVFESRSAKPAAERGNETHAA